MVAYLFNTSAQDDLSRIGGFGTAAPTTSSTSKSVQTYYPAMNVHPFRKVRYANGEIRFADLTPLFKWNHRGSYSHPSESPMPTWHPLLLRVTQGSTNGILATQINTAKPHQIFLENFPNSENQPDNSTILAFGFTAGTFTFTDTYGVKHTVPAFDYGTPYSPATNITTLTTNNNQLTITTK